jgi:hypothetical protein
MSIKSKGKTKQRPVSRGPRREPVPVPKPFVHRRWVQLTTIFIVGVFAMTVFVWATNGLRGDRASNQAAQELSTRQRALSQWKTVVESQFTALGQLQGAVPPIVASDISAAVQALDKGQDPTATAKDLESSANELAKAAKTIDDFDLPTAITDQGFDAAGSTALTSSKAELVQALRLYEQAAKLAATAMSSEGETRTQLAESAKAIEDSASSLLQSGWIKYSSVLTQNQLSAGGTPSGLSSGLTGGAG